MRASNLIFTLFAAALLGSGCGPSAGNKTLVADILLPSEVQGMNDATLVLTVADTSGSAVVWGPGGISADADGLYQADCGALPQGDYLAQVAVQVPHSSPQISASLPPGLVTDEPVTLAYALQTISVSGASSVTLSFKPADFSFNLDPDGDSLFSLNEYLSGLDPMNPDTDGDGLGDYVDNFPLDLSETIDEDGDGFGNGGDNCPFAANAAQEDFDGDDQGDVCDPDDDNDGLADSLEAGLGSDPFDADTDDDGVDDASDHCLLAADAGQGDTDADGAGNACDTDDDNDSIPDLEDLCPHAADADQADTDGDGIGDACTGDDDGDGLPDDADNCRFVSNTAQNDSDSDGAGDACDTDDDNDGLSDAEESGLGADHVLTNSLASDTDGDGLGDASDNCPLEADPDTTDSDQDGDGDACDCDPYDAAIGIRRGIFVATSGTDANTGALNAPVRTLARALEIAAAAGSDVYLTAGQYAEAVSLVSGVSIYGGFPAGTGCLRDLAHVSEITSSSRTTVTGAAIKQNTTIDGVWITNTFAPSSSEAGTAVHLTSSVPQSTTQVFISRSRISGPDNPLGESAGLRVDGASPSLVNNVIEGGASSLSRAVILNNAPRPSFHYNTMRGESASGTGSPRALASSGSAPELMNNILTTDLGATDQRILSFDDASLDPGIVIQDNLLAGASGGYAPKLYSDKVGGGRLYTSAGDLNALDPNGILEGDGISGNQAASSDPAGLFEDYANGDYHLSDGNETIDAGAYAY